MILYTCGDRIKIISDLKLNGLRLSFNQPGYTSPRDIDLDDEPEMISLSQNSLMTRPLPSSGGKGRKHRLVQPPSIGQNSDPLEELENDQRGAGPRTLRRSESLPEIGLSQRGGRELLPRFLSLQELGENQQSEEMDNMTTELLITETFQETEDFLKLEVWPEIVRRVGKLYSKKQNQEGCREKLEDMKQTLQQTLDKSTFDAENFLSKTSDFDELEVEFKKLEDLMNP